MIARETQIQFYEHELRTIELDTKEVNESPPINLIARQELFRGLYKGYDAVRGNVFVDFRWDKHTPRLDQTFTAFIVTEQHKSLERWSQIQYRDLLEELNSESDLSEIRVVNFMAADDPKLVRAICRDVSLTFIERRRQNELICFGPTRPPVEYLCNLLALSKKLPLGNPHYMWEKLLLGRPSVNSDRMPILLTEIDDIPQLLADSVHNNRISILQGPPGTGKTHQVADLIGRLLSKSQSVLLTAQTNRSVLEVCAKPFLKPFIQAGRVGKTALSATESSTYPKLTPIRDITAKPGQAVLATFYQFSRCWLLHDEPVFDYIIVEEASQAFLTTLAAALRLGQHVVVVGDPYQLKPIVQNDNAFDRFQNVESLVNGLQTLCSIETIPFYRKVETRRLMKRSTRFTNLFYQNTIQSLAINKSLDNDINQIDNKWKTLIPSAGGPVFLSYNQPAVHKQLPAKVIQVIATLLEALFSDLTKQEVAVLVPFRETLSQCQKELKPLFSDKLLSIETVDRVQGLDVDYCFYLLPDAAYSHSLDRNRFNVATSRARKVTFIVAHHQVTNLAVADPSVLNYLRDVSREATHFL